MITAGKRRERRRKIHIFKPRTSVCRGLASAAIALVLEVSWEFWIGVACVTPTRSARSPWDASATCLHCGWQLWCPAGGLDGRTHRQHVSASLFGNLRPPSQREENFGREGWEKQKHTERDLLFFFQEFATSRSVSLSDWWDVRQTVTWDDWQVGYRHSKKKKKKVLRFFFPRLFSFLFFFFCEGEGTALAFGHFWQAGLSYNHKQPATSTRKPTLSHLMKPSDR